MASKKVGGIRARGYEIPTRYANLFGKNFKFINESGHMKERFLPLGMKSGQDYYRFRRYKEFGRERKFGRWKTRLGNVGGIMTMPQFLNHLKVASYNIDRNSINFAVILSERALQIFKTSFKLKRFNSRGSSAWPKLSNHTIKSRIKHNTWPGAGRELMELGELYYSVKQEQIGKGGRVFTDPKSFRKEKYKSGHKRRHICYAAVHNEGKEGGYYFWGNRPAVRRQFIGHSTLLIEFANRVVKRYLFDDVFVTK